MKPLCPICDSPLDGPSEFRNGIVIYEAFECPSCSTPSRPFTASDIRIAAAIRARPTPNKESPRAREDSE